MDHKLDKEQILAEIREAFAGVTREGGVSWQEAKFLECSAYTDEEYAAAQASDLGRDWIDVANDPEWRIEIGAAVFSFLDPIGYRYYLPAAMTVAVRGGECECICYSLINQKSYTGDDMTEYHLNQWSLLDARQRKCVRHFLEFMRGSDESEWQIDAEWWSKALDSYWKDA